MTEKDCYIIEAALQHGFQMANGEGTEFICTEEQIVALVTPYRDAAERYQEAYENMRDFAISKGLDVTTHGDKSENPT
jgi:hypothetical protein